MNLTQRRLIGIFKTFVEKVFVPQLPKMDILCQQEWNKFNAMISVEAINYGQLQLYADTLATSGFNGSSGMMDKKNKSPFIPKARKESMNQNSREFAGGFNPSKTFGGNRARVPMFPLKQELDSPDKDSNPINGFGRFNDQSMEEKSNLVTTQTMLPVLERLFKNFSENHEKMEQAQYSNGQFFQIKAFQT